MGKIRRALTHIRSSASQPQDKGGGEAAPQGSFRALRPRHPWGRLEQKSPEPPFAASTRVAEELFHYDAANGLTTRVPNATVVPAKGGLSIISDDELFTVSLQQTGLMITQYTAGGNVIGLIGLGIVTGIELHERDSGGVAVAANEARIFAKDNGAGKTQLVAKFPTGAVQILATEP